MYTFFVQLYFSLFLGSWQDWLQQNASMIRNDITILIKNIFNFAVNALGGNFETIQTFNIYEGMGSAIVSGGNSGLYCTSLVLAFITCIGICAVVWKLTKMVFSIFFSRA